MRMMRMSFCLATLSMALFAGIAAGAGAEDLEKGFVQPPDSARPQTWWHWMNGNITKEGITADLEAMARVGVGGAQIFNAGEGIPHGTIQFNSPEWVGMVKHAAKEAQRLGLELCIHNCAGWSSSGGPWNTPEHGMKVVVTSEKQVKGPMRFDGKLAQPPTKLDFYRDMMLGDIVNGPRGKVAHEWAARQSYIALGNLMTAAALLGVDGCPLEGINPVEYDKILGLGGNGYKTVVALALGYRGDGDKYATLPKVRYPAADLIKVV